MYSQKDKKETKENKSRRKSCIGSNLTPCGNFLK
jgi:hypothetical protein